MADPPSEAEQLTEATVQLCNAGLNALFPWIACIDPCWRFLKSVAGLCRDRIRKMERR